MVGAAATYNIVYHYGDSLDGLSAQWLDSAGDAKDITGYLASMMAKDKITKDTVLQLDSDSLGGLQIIVGTDGTVTVNASPTLMRNQELEEGVTYEYDLQVRSSDGSIVKTLIKGDFQVDNNVTDVV